MEKEATPATTKTTAGDQQEVERPRGKPASRVDSTKTSSSASPPPITRSNWRQVGSPAGPMKINSTIAPMKSAMEVTTTPSRTRHHTRVVNTYDYSFSKDEASSRVYSDEEVKVVYDHILGNGTSRRNYFILGEKKDM